MTPELLARLDQARRDKRPVVLATRLPGGEQALLPDDPAPAELAQAAGVRCSLSVVYRELVAQGITRKKKSGGRPSRTAPSS